MLHKLDGFIWLATVSVHCYCNALQHNGLGQSVPDTEVHTLTDRKKKEKKKGTYTETNSMLQGNSNSNEKNSHEAGTGLTNTFSPLTTKEKHLRTI